MLTLRRRSPRLAGVPLSTSSTYLLSKHPLQEETSEVKVVKKRQTRSSSSAAPEKVPTKSPRRRKRKKSEDSAATQNEKKETTPEDCLARTREVQLLSSQNYTSVMGIDEAGRGPLAGPVVCAAAVVPTNISGVVDSKKITKEEERERLYEELVNSSEIQWAVAVISAQRIDEINILQATLEGMKLAAQAVMNPPKDAVKEASVTISGCYVVCSPPSKNNNTKSKKKTNEQQWYALVDGNRLPKDMPLPCEAMVKGDSREYSIAAASILAKVTRDRLMGAYHEMYPEYNLAQHKGYPTAAHMGLVKELGASPIHRRSFAPLKHMEFDENGRIIDNK